jgi:hypothetical protein
MSFLIHNLPPYSVYVRKEFLYDHQKGHGEITPGTWISVKSVQHKALYFETLLTDYGALFDKLPLSAFVWKTDYDPDKLLPLDTLQLWDCFDYDLTVIEKPLLNRCSFFGKDRQMHDGQYCFTIDNCHAQSSTLNTNYSQDDPEHKSFNIIALDNGQFAAQPNNRIQWRDMSLIPENTKTPDFEVCSQNYQVENSEKWSVGHTTEWQYKSKSEDVWDEDDKRMDVIAQNGNEGLHYDENIL